MSALRRFAESCERAARRRGPRDILLLASLAFLYAPVVLFLATWVKLWFALPVTICCAFLVSSCSRRPPEEGRGARPDVREAGSSPHAWAFLVGFAALLAWCVLSGLGAWVSQASDWDKHNLILSELAAMPWPVRHALDGSHAVMSYYIGSYLVPAAFGKLFGFGAAEQAMLAWSWAGLCLGCLGIHRAIGGRGGLSFLVVCAVLALFGTFGNYLTALYGALDPEDAGSFWGHWMSQSAVVQYPSDIVMLRWVPTQFVPLLVAVSVFLQSEDDASRWGALLAPLSLCSTFAFAGLAAVMALLVPGRAARNRLRGGVLCWRNGAALIVAACLCVYLACNVLQPKPDEAKMAISLVDYPQHPWVLVLFELSWAVWAAALLPAERGNPLLWASGAVLLVLPLLSFGRFNDLCMRASMPALLVLCSLVAKNLIGASCLNRPYCAVLAVLVALSGAFPACELYEAAFVSGDPARCVVHEGFESFVSAAPHYKYQYYAWDSAAADLLLQ